MVTFNGQRLKEARYFKRMSITELAEKLNVSKQMISKYENGISEPNAEKMFQINRILGFPIAFYQSSNKYISNRSKTFYRSRLTTTQKQKAPAEMLKIIAVEYRDLLEQYIDFPRIDDITNFNTENMGHEEVSKVLREKWGIGNAPIPNMVALLESKGFVIADIPEHMDKVDAIGGSCSINDNNYYVMLTSKEGTDFYRQQFSLAHELGHWILHDQDYDPVELDASEYKEMEKEANNFASSFLMPENLMNELFGHDTIDVQRLFSKKNILNVSAAAMMYRLKSLGILSESAYISLQRKFSYNNWRKNEPFSTHELSNPNAFFSATELLVDNNILSKQEILLELEMKYGRTYPNSLLEDVLNLPKGYFSKSTDNITEFRLKN